MTYCCVQCRLLQPPTTGCAECASPMIGPVELVRELLYYRDMKMFGIRDWGMVTALIAGGSIAFPVLAPVALGSMAALAVHKLRGLRRRTEVAGVQLAPPTMAPGADLLTGTARRFRSTVTSLDDRAPVLAEHAAVLDHKRGVLVRRSLAAPFWLDVDDGRHVLVSGPTRRWPRSSRPLEPLRAGDSRIAELGLPEAFKLSGQLEHATLVEAAPVVVAAVVEESLVPELAFHRDGGQVLVARGRPGQPVLLGY